MVGGAQGDNITQWLTVETWCTHLTFPLLTVTVLASFGSSLLYGYNLAVVNSPAVHIKAFYNASWSQRYSQSPSQELLTVMYSLTVSVFALGGLVGSLPVQPWLWHTMGTPRYGRNGTLVRSPLLVFLAGILMGSSRYLELPEMVIAGRFVTGLHSGICLSVVPMYLGEIAPKNLRGFLGLVPSIFICLGVFSAQVLGLPELLGEVSAASGLHGAAVPWMRYLSVACVIGIIAGFCMGPAGVPFLMTAELFKQSHRPAAYIVGGSLNWLSNFTVGFVFPFLQMSAGAFCYLVFCGVCLLVALYIYVVIPETKNKTFMEISQIFAARRAFLATPASAVKMVALGGYGALESSSLELSESGQA
nr:solute carrier family 2, facilitated glucose transporter member 9-like [Pelodiscus sinensis]|eukprot:XP_025039741.1 solute carrier family 2, facilitated glucose transporter member 9-like [Pelodiscus sinensis]